MTIVNRHETGEPEALNKTIGAWIERHWLDSLTPDDLIPQFFYEDDRSENWPVKQAKLAIYFNISNTIKRADRSSAGKETTGYQTEVTIDGFAPTLLQAERCVENLTRIIQDNYANSSTRVLKSNNVHVSKITTFADEPDFRIIPKNASGHPNSVQFTGLLSCLWNTIKS